MQPQGDLLLIYNGLDFERPERYTNALNGLGWTFDVWKGPLSEIPLVGNQTSGMRSYFAVLWEMGLENYPPFSDPARDSVTRYLDGGGRFAISGHDIAWSFGSSSGAGASQFYTPERNAWLENTLHTHFIDDRAGWTGLTGVASDPISGAYTGGVSYSEHRSGASGDEISVLPGTGTASYDWRSVEGIPDNCGFRWESGGPLGTPGSGVWAERCRGSRRCTTSGRASRQSTTSAPFAATSSTRPSTGCSVGPSRPWW